MLLRCLPLLVALCKLSSAQRTALGVEAGVPVSSAVTANSERVAGTRHYTFGPTFGLLLLRGVHLEFECLYKRFDLGSSGSSQRLTVHRLEWPLYLRYQLRRGPATPFIQAGIAFNRIMHVGGGSICSRGPFGEEFYCINSTPVAELRHRSTIGVVAGAGVSVGRLGRMTVAPELRVTRWVDRNFGVSESQIRSTLTQAELLVGLSF